MCSNVKARHIREKPIGLIDLPARRPSMSRAQDRYHGKKLVSLGSFDRHGLSKTSALPFRFAVDSGRRSFCAQREDQVDAVRLRAMAPALPRDHI